MNRHIDYGRPRKPASAIVRLYRLAAVRWLEWRYGRALAQVNRDQRRICRLAQRRVRARLALYASRGIL